MPRCPNCHRRLAGDASCPDDGGRAPDLPEFATPAGQPAALQSLGYRITAPLGAGGFAVVWDAVDAGGRRCAVKIARSPSSIVAARFQREAAALRRVGAPHVPAVYEAGLLADGRAFIAMEHLPGVTLGQWLGRLPAPPDAAVAATLAARLVDCLAALHRAGDVHRDLTPDNVMLVGAIPKVAKSPPIMDDLRVALLDLGVAADRRRHGTGLTQTGMVVGTTDYMAPERLLDADRAAADSGDAADSSDPTSSDLYSLGVILYEMLTLHLPFAGDSIAVERGHLTHRPRRPSELVSVPAQLEEIVLSLLAKQPANRPTLASLRPALLPAATSPLIARRAAPVRDERRSRATGAQPVVLLYAEIASGISEVSDLAVQCGGFVAGQRGDAYVCAFAGGMTDDPTRTALEAAHRLVESGAERAVIHLARASIRQRGSSVRALGAAIDRPERWIPQTSWSGILVTAVIAHLLPRGATSPAPEQRGFHVPDELGAAGIAPETTILGRDAEIAACVEAIAGGLETDQPALVTILGDPGVGKSRLLDEVAGYAAVLAPGARLVRFSAPQRAIGELDTAADELAEQLRSLAAEFGEFEVAGASRDLGGDLVRAAALAPLLIFVDDAHRLASAVLDALEYATLPATERCPLAVVLAASKRLEVGRPLWGKRATTHQRIELDVLDPEAAATLAGHLLLPAEYPPATALRRLADWSGGSPARLGDLVRTLKREGLVRRRASGAGWFLAADELDRLPRSPVEEWIAARELEAVPREIASYARLCAVLGPHFHRREISHVIDGLEADGHATTAIDIDVGLAALCRRGILRRAGDELIFRTEPLQRGMYQSIATKERQAIHRCALTYWRSRDRALDEVLDRIARHAAGMNDTETAADAYLELADRARHSADHVLADRHYSGALDLIAKNDTARLGRALAGRGRSRYHVSRVDEAIADLRRARTMTQSGGDRTATIELLLEEATALDWAVRVDEAKQCVEHIESLVTADGAALTDPVIEFSERRPAPLFPPKPDVRSIGARLTLARARVAWRDERLEEALALFEAAVGEAAAAGDEKTRLEALLLLGPALCANGRLEAARERFAETIELATARGDRLHLCAAHGNRMFLWMPLGAVDKAIEDLGRATELARHLGHPVPEMTATYNHAELLFWSGDDEASIRLARRALGLAERFSPGSIAECQLLIARIHAVCDRRAEARSALGNVALESNCGPTMRLLFAAVEKLIGAGAAAWDEIEREARAALAPEELIEILYFRALAAWRRGMPDDASRYASEMRQQAESCPVWLTRIAALCETIDQPAETR